MPHDLSGWISLKILLSGIVLQLLMRCFTCSIWAAQGIAQHCLPALFRLILLLLFTGNLPIMHPLHILKLSLILWFFFFLLGSGVIHSYFSIGAPPTQQRSQTLCKYTSTHTGSIPHSLRSISLSSAFIFSLCCSAVGEQCQPITSLHFSL